MKKSIFIICCTLLFALSSSAQPITLSPDNMKLTAVTGVSTLAPVVINDPSTVSALFTSQSVNATWDLTGLYYGPTFTHTRLTGPAPYNYNDTAFNNINDIDYHYLHLNYVDVGGVTQFGIEVDTQVYSPYPNASSLNVQFTTQVIPFNVAYHLLPLPLTYQDNWIAIDQFRINFNIEDTNLLPPTGHTYNYEPGYLIENLSETDNVVGWGIMRVNRLDSANNALVKSGYIHVLEVQKILTQIDSANIRDTGGVYYKMLDSLGFSKYYVSNGTDSTVHYHHTDTTVTYEKLFYRRGTLTPLATVVFADGSFDSVLSVQVNTDSLSTTNEPLDNEGISNVSTTAKVSVYPNPVSNNQVFIDISDAQAGAWSYNLINAAGEVVATNSLPSTGGQVHTQIALSRTLAAGVYYMQINNAGKQVSIRSLDIIK